MMVHVSWLVALGLVFGGFLIGFGVCELMEGEEVRAYRKIARQHRRNIL